MAVFMTGLECSIEAQQVYKTGSNRGFFDGWIKMSSLMFSRFDDFHFFLVFLNYEPPHTV